MCCTVLKTDLLLSFYFDYVSKDHNLVDFETLEKYYRYVQVALPGDVLTDLSYNVFDEMDEQFGRCYTVNRNGRSLSITRQSRQPSDSFLRYYSHTLCTRIAAASASFASAQRTVANHL